MLLRQLNEAAYDNKADLKPQNTNWSSERVLETFYDKETEDADYDDEDSYVNWKIKSGLVATYDGHNVSLLSGTEGEEEVYWIDSNDSENSGVPSNFEIYQTRLLYSKTN